MKKANIFVIFGPTSSGKTSLAIKLSKKLNGIIISADSRQVYKEMNIGTGKVPIKSNYDIQKLEYKWVINDIDLYGYDLVFPNEYFSAYDFYNYINDVIEVEHKKEKNIFLVGGTGFYIDVVTGKSSMSGIKPNPELRKQLENKTTNELFEILNRLNKKMASNIDKENRNRLIRAIEIASTFNNAKSYKNEQISSELTKYFDFIYLGLTANRETLYNRVDGWLDEIWKNGLLDETKYLLAKYKNSDKLNGLVYRSVVEFLNNNIKEEEAIQKSKYDLHHYIRRQETWFKRYSDANLFAIEDKKYYEKILNLLQSNYQL